MKDNSSSPDSSSPDFNHSAEMPESTRISIELYKLGDIERHNEHKALVALQEEKLKKTIADFKERREGAIQFWKQEFLKQEATKVHPALKPTDFPQEEQRIQERAAHAQAVVHVKQIERTRIIEIKVEFVVQQKDILNSSMSEQVNKEFRKAASEAIQQSFERNSKGRSL